MGGRMTKESNKEEKRKIIKNADNICKLVKREQ
jgi:hypothetical protein